MADLSLVEVAAVTVEGADGGTKLTINSDGSLNAKLPTTTNTGTITAVNGNVAVATSGFATVVFNITGTWVASLTTQGTVDGTNWFTVNGLGMNGSTITPISSNNTLIVPCAGLLQVRILATAFTSGTVNVAYGVGPFESLTPFLSQLQAINTNTGAQSTDTIFSGTITALNGSVPVNAQGDYTVSANITGTWVGTLVAEGQLADSTWIILPMYIISPTTIPYVSTFSTTANGAFLITGGGYYQVRIRASAYTSGTVSVALDASLAQQTIFSSQLGSWTVNPGNTPNTTPWLAKAPDSNLWVTATGTTGSAVTLTLPAVAAAFHHINTIEIEAYSTAARTGGATPIIVTSTNLPGSPAWTFATAAAIGTTDTKSYTFPSFLNSSVVNTATTIVCPATTGIIWRVNVSYYTGA